MWKLFKLAKLGRLKVFTLLLFIGLQVVGIMLLPRLTADIINYGVLMGDRDYVFRTGALMLGVAFLTAVFAVLTTYYSAEVATRFAKHTRERLFNHTMKLSYQDFRHFNTSSLITRATNDIEQLQSTLGMVFEMLLPAPVVVIVGLALTFSRDAYLALIILITMIVFAIVAAVMIVIAFPMFAKVQKGLDKINAFVGQYVTGIRVVRAFNRTRLERARTSQAFQEFAKINIKINRLYAALMPIVFLVMSLATVAIVWFGGHRVAAGSIQIGDIMSILEYSWNIIFYLIMAAFVVIYLPRAKVCAGRILEVLNHQPEICDGKSHVSNRQDLSLEFDNVGFRYLDAENPVLHNINFTCKKGTTTAIIGGTGSGKSTIARLIPRLLDATTGQIILSGSNIKDISQEELRQRVGFVPQKAFLFSGTIADNLRHGNPKATLRDMKRAANIAQSDDFIGELDDTYEAHVVQGGRNFSGGQRQRMAIARMLIKKPDIYVFDDSFSALDFKTDAALRRALKEVTQEAIVINIVQRITTVMDADQIIVLDEGKIVGIGTHRELLATCLVYQEIAKSQLSPEELEREFGGGSL
jgi:ATP-binding cassette subfamily B protein